MCGAGQPLLVVVNETLMENHQQELASALEAERYLWSCTPQTLLKRLAEVLTELASAPTPSSAAKAKQPATATANVLKPYPGLPSSFAAAALSLSLSLAPVSHPFFSSFAEVDRQAFAKLLDQEMGF